MRPAETEARGTITNIMLIMRKLIMICMVYWMKAIMSDVYKRQEFVFTAGEQEFYASRGFENEPQRCKACLLYTSRCV